MSNESTSAATPSQGGRRHMPAEYAKQMIPMKGGRMYLQTMHRVAWFREECPDWGIVTELHAGGTGDQFACVTATILNAEGRIISMGTKTETKADFPAGWVEKAETGAIGRALALAGFGSQFAPDLEEGRIADSPVGRGQSAQAAPAANGATRPVNNTGAKCPSCNAPDGKAHTSKCLVAAKAAAPTPVETPDVANAFADDDTDAHCHEAGGVDIRIWQGPGQCTRCHAPEGKMHGKPCV